MNETMTRLAQMHEHYDVEVGVMLLEMAVWPTVRRAQSPVFGADNRRSRSRKKSAGEACPKATRFDCGETGVRVDR